MITNAFKNNSLFIDYDISVNKFYLILAYSLATIFGFIGNGLILICFQYDKKLKALPTRSLIQTIAFLGIFQISVLDTLTCFYILSYEEYIPAHTLCKLSASVSSFVSSGGFWSACCISLLRYCLCNANANCSNFTLRSVNVWPWVVSLYGPILIVLNILPVQYDKRLYACLYVLDGSLISTTIFFGVSKCLPLIIILILNFLVHRGSLDVLLTTNQKRMMRTAPAVLISSLIFDCPMLVVTLVRDLSLPTDLYSWISFCACLNSPVNCVIYGLYNKSFRHSVTMILKCKKFGKPSQLVVQNYKQKYIAQK